MIKYLTLIILLTFPLQIYAQDAWSFRFEPLYGVEHTQNRYPEPARYSTRTFFGLRVLMGVPLLSLELEGTQANDRRDYPSENQKAEDKVQRGLIGLRTTVPTSSWLAIYGRAGARATMQETVITNTLDDTKETKKPPLQWDPYAGAGVQVAVSSLFALSAGATWFFPDSGRPDVQYSFGFTVKYGQVR